MVNLGAREWDTSNPGTPQPRTIQHIPTHGFREGKGWQVFEIKEGVKGMLPTDHFYDMSYEAAVKKAKEANLALGIKRNELLDILLFSGISEDPSVAVLAKQADAGEVRMNEWGSDVNAVAKAWQDKDFKTWLSALGDAHLLTVYNKESTCEEAAKNFNLGTKGSVRFQVEQEIMKRMKHNNDNQK